MEINVLSTNNSQQNGSGSLSINQTVKIDNPSDLNGRKIYRHIYYLRFEIDPSCDGVVINRSMSKIEGYFQDYILQLYNNDVTFQTKSWQEAGSSSELVKVHLTHPWYLHSVSTTDHRGVEVLRLDGEAVSAEPTISGNSNSPFHEEFIGQDFALRKVPSANGWSMQSTELQDEPFSLEQESAFHMTVGATAITPVPALTKSAAMAHAAQYGIRSINLKSMVTGPRILLGKIGQTPDLEIEPETISLWQKAGQVTSAKVDFLKDEAELENVLDQLQKGLDEFFENSLENKPETESTLYLPLIFECDTPARLMLSQLKLQYSLLRKQFHNSTNGTGEKTTLKFNGGKLENKQLQLNLPDQSEIDTAQLKISSQLKNGSGFASLSSLTDLATLHSGIKINVGETVGKLVTIVTPQQTGAILLASLPLAEEIVCTVKIVEDVNMTANGAVLSENKVTIRPAMNRQWLVINFSTPCLLDIGNYWLQLTINQGAIVWLAESGKGEIRLVSPEKIEKKITTLILQSYLGFKADRDKKTSDIGVKISDLPADVQHDSNSLFIVDLAPALNAHYQQSQNLNKLAEINFIADGAGNITIQELQVLYNI